MGLIDDILKGIPGYVPPAPGSPYTRHPQPGTGTGSQPVPPSVPGDHAVCKNGGTWNGTACVCPGGLPEDPITHLCSGGGDTGDCPPGEHHAGGNPNNPCRPNPPGAPPPDPGPSGPVEHSEGTLQDLLYTMYIDRLGGFASTPGLGTELPGQIANSPDVMNLPGGGIASGSLPAGLTTNPFAGYAPPPSSSLEVALAHAHKNLGNGGNILHGGPVNIVQGPPIDQLVYKDPRPPLPRPKMGLGGYGGNLTYGGYF